MNGNDNANNDNGDNYPVKIMVVIMKWYRQWWECKEDNTNNQIDNIISCNDICCEYL